MWSKKRYEAPSHAPAPAAVPHKDIQHDKGFRMTEDFNHAIQQTVDDMGAETLAALHRGMTNLYGKPRGRYTGKISICS